MGIQDDSIASHPLKTMGSFARKLTPRKREIFQELVDDGFTQFKNAVKEGRPNFRKNPAALDKLATGQVFTAQQALENGLIDKIGFIEDAIDRAIQSGHLDKASVKVVKYKAEPRLSDLLFGQTRVKPSFDLAALLEASTPALLSLHLAPCSGWQREVNMEASTRVPLHCHKSSARRGLLPAGPWFVLDLA